MYSCFVIAGSRNEFLTSSLTGSEARRPTLVNPGDSSLLFNHDILGKREISQCRGLSLARIQHPVQKTCECVPRGVVGRMDRNNHPGKGTNWISVRTRSVHDRRFGVVTDFHGVARSRGDAFQISRDELAIPVSNSAVGQVILQGIDEFNIPN
jgi:hypothetical protein